MFGCDHAVDHPHERDHFILDLMLVRQLAFETGTGAVEMKSRGRDRPPSAQLSVIGNSAAMATSKQVVVTAVIILILSIRG